MNKFIIASAAAALMMGVSGSAFAQTSAADCQSMFQKADLNKDGSLQADEAKVFLDAMNQAQAKPQDASMVTQDEFMTACQKDAFVNIDPATIGIAAGQAPADQAPADQATTDQTTTTTDQTATTTQTTDQPAATQPTTTEETAATQPTTTEETAATQPTEQALAAPAGLLASNLIGTTVFSQDNQSIGDINDIILSQEGQASQVIVGVGGFLGIGEKDVILDMAKLQIATTDDGKVKVIAQTSEEELKNLPAFMKQQPGQEGQQQQDQEQQQ